MPRSSRLGGLGLAISGAALLLACSAESPVAPTEVPAVASGGLVSEGSPNLTSSTAGPTSADIMNQGGMGVYAPGGAKVVRQPNGLRLSISMPTPEPDTYIYAPGFMVVGPPEVFTLWAFVFNFPENCTAPCDSNDLGDTPAQGGAYNIGGHVASGNSLTIAGRIGVGEAPLRAFHAALQAPGTAEVHLAVAPHGALDPTRLPGDFRNPTGSPACGCWWIAMFH